MLATNICILAFVAPPLVSVGRRYVPARMDLSNLVAEQAKEIAELRKMVEEMQHEREEHVGDPLFGELDAIAAKTTAAQVESTQEAAPSEEACETSSALQDFVNVLLSAPVEERGAPRLRPNSKTPVYKLFGELPPGFNAAPIERLVARRVTARLKKHYSEADRLQKRILRMGVRLDDRHRTWSLQKGWKGKQDQLAEEDQQSWRQQQKRQVEVERRVRNLFSFWDEDGNGLIDREEFRLVMQVLAIPGTPESYDRVFDKWDADDSGELCLDEVKAAINALQESEDAKKEPLA